MARQLPFVIAGILFVGYALFLILKPNSVLNSFLGSRNLYRKPNWPKWLIPNPDYERLSTRIFGLIFLLFTAGWECLAVAHWTGVQELTLYSTAFMAGAMIVFWVAVVVGVLFESLRLFRATREGLWQPACERLANPDWKRTESVLFACLAIAALVIPITVATVLR